MLHIGAEIAIVAIAVVVCLWCFRPTEWTTEGQLDALTKLLRPGRLDHLRPFVVEASRASSADRDFWCALHGLRGLSRLTMDISLVIRIMQVGVESGIILPEEAKVVWASARRQIFFSLAAIPEAVVCALFRGWPHSAASQAVYHHCFASGRLAVLCKPGAPHPIHSGSSLP